ncbi:MAG: D-glycero-beta-D-manno-heptose 1-phosphate adenylyltransferase [Planctomycetota bacterium]|nr:D-glycero-beta-D-manno-heptose 1-phosphate adenylyltransferase [Planctomycetota bacterium]
MTPFKEPDREAVRALLRAMEGRSVLVVGDGMLDGYLYGTAARLSPEAPVQVVQVEREEYLLGGAANVAKCLVALGAKVSLCCVVGTDAHGQQFVDEAQSLGIDTRLVFRDPARPTTVKTRIVAGRQHMLRVDRESRTPLAEKLLSGIAAAVRAAAAGADAVLLSDYAKGVLDESVCAAAIRAAGAKPVLADPKGNHWEHYAHATVLKPNWREAAAFLAAREPNGPSLSPQTGDRDVEQAAHRLRQALGVRNVLVTRGAQGVSLACADGASVSFPSRATEVQDEAGAGDVVAAAACLALAAGADVRTAAWLGNVAAGAKVAKFGTHTVSDYEILEALGERFPQSERKLLTKAQAAELAATLRAAGKKVVFTNGCFDILHLGHGTLLEKARQLGDALIVGVNTDASVRRLKGPDRPVNPEGDRARLLTYMGCVDAVVFFDDDTPIGLIKAVKPDVICKGGDYRGKEEVVGWDLVESFGGRVVLIDHVAGRSTSKVIERAAGR